MTSATRSNCSVIGWPRSCRRRGRHHDANYHRQCQATATHYYQSRHDYVIETRLMHVAAHTRRADTLISRAPARRTCADALKHFPPHSTDWLPLILCRVRLRFLLYTISRTLPLFVIKLCSAENIFFVYSEPRERVMVAANFVLPMQLGRELTALPRSLSWIWGATSMRGKRG